MRKTDGLVMKKHKPIKTLCGGDNADGVRGSVRPSSIMDGLKAMPKNRPSEERVALLAARYAAGQDLWTGLPLKPTDTAVIPVPDEDDDEVI